MKKLLILIVAHMALHSVAFGQKEGYHGVFGEGIQIDFNTSPPTITYPPTSLGRYDPMSAWEGTATISDKDGNLLFYTDGMVVWNKHHQVMPNGTSIHSTQSLSTTQVLIVPIPGDPYLYYIFVAGHQEGPLKQILVDMRLNNGLGDVLEKDKTLFEGSTEKLQVIPHATENALWLITHEYGSNRFRTYYIGMAGINPQYVESAVGSQHSGGADRSAAMGYMKSSPSGTRLALAVYGIGILELLDFDPVTGKVSNPKTIMNDKNAKSYGIAFSPDESKLFTTTTTENLMKLLQYDLNAGSAENIAASARLISTNVTWSLQLAPDDKIYVISQHSDSFLGVIHNPNIAGEQCMFIRNEIPLTERKTTVGLPEFPRYPLQKTEGIVFENGCAGNEVAFNLTNKTEVQSVSWNFGDEASGTLNQSTLLSPVHLYNAPGRYTVQAEVVFTNNQIRSYQQVVSVFESPAVSLGNDIIACSEYVMLTPAVTGEPVSFRWQDGSTAPLLQAFKSGKYWVEVKTPYCTATDTIEVKINRKPQLNLSEEPICVGGSYSVNLKEPYTTYHWSDGYEGGSREIALPGQNTLTATNGCGTSVQQISVSEMPQLQPNLPEQVKLCVGEHVELDATTPFAQYRWQDGSTEAFRVISEPGTYWVELYNKCETVRRTIEVDYQNPGDFTLYNVNYGLIY